MITENDNNASNDSSSALDNSSSASDDICEVNYAAANQSIGNFLRNIYRVRKN